MELEKQQRLHDTLAKLAPKGKYGGLGSGGVGTARRKRSDSLPDNPLYSNFVRAGAGHKRNFEEIGEDGKSEVISSESKKSKYGESSEPGDGGGGEGDVAAHKRMVLDLLEENENALTSKKLAKLVQKHISGLNKKEAKQLTIEVVNILAGEGRVALDDDIVKFLPRPTSKMGKKKEKKKKKRRMAVMATNGL